MSIQKLTAYWDYPPRQVSILLQPTSIMPHPTHSHTYSTNYHYYIVIIFSQKNKKTNHDMT
jgi:hypothetical protein